MNVGRMLELAKGLEELEALDGLMRFEFGHFIEEDHRFPNLGGVREAVKQGEFCGTSGCIAGWACWLWGEDADKINDDVAQRLLDLTDDQVSRLFYNNGRWINGDPACGAPLRGVTGQFDVTRAEAAQALRRMVEEEAGFQVLPLDSPENVYRAIAEVFGEEAL